jgi:hypothetical protein
MISYVELVSSWRKGLRNGNWWRLGMMDKIFYKAATRYAEIKSKITNNRMITKLKTIADRLKTTIKRKIMEAGIERVKEILSRFGENGVFRWIPQLKTWLKDPRYIIWLAINSQHPRNN